MNNKQTPKIYTDVQTQTEEQFDKDLISAIQENEKVRRLIAQSIDLNVHDEKTGDTPLILAIKTEDVKMVKILLDAKADPNQYNIDNESPLDYSLDLADNVISELLLEYGADINKYPKEGIPHIWYAVDSGKDIDKLKFLRKHGALIDDMWEDQTPLMRCITKCTYENYSYILDIITFLLENRANIDEQDSNGDTVLHHALEMEDPKGSEDPNFDELGIIKTLLQYGADVTIENNEGITPLNKALHSNKKAYHLFDYITNWRKLY